MSNWHTAKHHHEGDTGGPYTTDVSWRFEPSADGDHGTVHYYRRQESVGLTPKKTRRSQRKLILRKTKDDMDKIIHTEVKND